MVPVRKFLPVAVIATALIAACSDASSTQPWAAAGSSLASKGGSGGGGGGGGGGGNSGGGNSGGSVTQLVVTTRPNADVTGKWIGTTDGPDITHTYTYVLSQTGAGIVSGGGTVVTPFTTVSESILGTVNGDTLTLYVGVQCNTCTLTPLYRGIISSSGASVSGSFFNGGVSPLTLTKQ